MDERCPVGLTAQDKVAEAELKKRRPVLDFEKIGIPNGSMLAFQDGVTQVKVLTSRKVEFDGQVCILVTPTRKLLGLADDYPIQPSPYWTFEGKTLKELYEDYHGEQCTVDQFTP